MSEFAFDEVGTFQEGFEAFLVEMEKTDAGMGKILRENAAALRSIVTDGDRDAKKRTAFNSSVLKALDGLVEKTHVDGEK